MDIQEVKYLFSVVLNFQFNKQIKTIMQKLDQNADSVMTLAEFVLFCRYHPEMLKPVKKIQLELRNHIVYARFWRQLMKKRDQYFPKQSILIIRDLWDENYAQLSMDYLNLQTEEEVPGYYVEQWKLTQRKKLHSYKGNIELPYELGLYQNQTEEQIS